MKEKNEIIWLFSFLKNYRWLFLLSLISTFVFVWIQLYTPKMVGIIIDAIAIKDPNYPFLYALGKLFLLYLLYSLCSFCITFFHTWIAANYGHKIRFLLSEKLSRLPISFFHHHPNGDILARFSIDIETISDGLLQILTTMLSATMTIVFATIFMFQLDWRFTCIVLLCAPFTYLVAKFITKRSHHYVIKQANDIGNLQAIAQEQLQNISIIQNDHSQDIMLQKYQTYNEILYESGYKAQFYGSLANPSTRLVTNISYSITGFCGALLCLYGNVSVGLLSSFLLYATIYCKPFNEISNIFTQFQAAIASSKRIMTFLAEQEEQDPGTKECLQCKGGITFQHVSFSYDKQRPLLENISFHIPAGTKVAIVGATGAGKTTILQLLLRFYDIDKGQILLDGNDVTSYTKDSYRNHFGFVLQDHALLDDTIFHVIKYGNPDATLEDVIQVAKQTGAHEFISALKHGYDTPLSLAALSQGQRQILSITQVILKDPSIVVLDEATSSMDTRSEAMLLQAIKKLQQQRTSFIIAHRLSTILDSDMIFMMKDGTIVEQGTHRQLMQKKKEYYALYQSQYQMQE